MSTIKANTLSNVAGSLSISTDRVAQGTAAAWVNFNGTGTVAIRASYNVTSITDNGTGDYTVNFTAALSDANYAVAGVAGAGSAGASTIWGFSATPTTSAFRFGAGTSSGGANTDYAYVSLAFFR